MKLIVDDELIQQYPDLELRLELLLIDSNNCKDVEGKRTLGPIQIDISEFLYKVTYKELK